MQREDEPAPFRQATDRPLHGGDELRGSHHAVGRGGRTDEQLHRLRLPLPHHPLVPQVAHGGVPDCGEEVALHRRAHVPGLATLPDVQKDLLHDLLGQIPHPDEPVSERAERRVIGVEQRLERSAVARADTRNRVAFRRSQGMGRFGRPRVTGG